MRTKEQDREMWAGKYWADHDNMDNLTDDKLREAFEYCVMQPSKEDYRGIKKAIKNYPGKILDELYELTLIEYNRPLNKDEARKYISMIDFCNQRNIEIPFGIEI